jgi:hypothetical protein
MSVVPPGPYGATIVTARDGKACADAGGAAISADANRKRKRKRGDFMLDAPRSSHTEQSLFSGHEASARRGRADERNGHQSRNRDAGFGMRDIKSAPHAALRAEHPKIYEREHDDHADDSESEHVAHVMAGDALARARRVQDFGPTRFVSRKLVVHGVLRKRSFAS